MSVIGGLRVANGFDVALEAEALADHEAPGLERLVPRDVEVLPVDLAGSEERDPNVVPRIGHRAAVLDVHHDGARDVTDREITTDLPLVVRHRADVGAAEPELGVVLDI